ncbi:MAG: NADP-dependent oxidoreductase, partial [Microlunatus sp.]|nr:NADP-dependent oxidoreductase [Microlunatus sp.]
SELPDPGPGEIVVRNLAISVDPYMRGRMRDVPSYAPPWRLDEPAQGAAVGEVIAANDAPIAVGSHVVHNLGWRDVAVLPAGQATVVPRRDGISPTLHLGALGMPGRTAYVGLIRIAKFKPGDVVFVSGAAGAVGSIAGQLAKLSGAGRVIGSAGSTPKINHLRDRLGFDAAFDYHDGPASELLAEAAPDGIDVFFDNVGGEQLEAAIGRMRVGGRIAICGAISGYNATQPQPGPRNLAQFIAKRLTMTGFLVGDHADLAQEATQKLGDWYVSGKLIADETIVHGLENTPAAFIGMLRGENTGKMLVNLD